MRGKIRDYKTIHVYVNKVQYADFSSACSKTSCRSLSQYARQLLLGKPVTIFYRDQAFDEFNENYIKFKNEMKRLLEKECLTIEEKLAFQEYLSGIKKIVNSISDKCSLK